MSGQSLLALDTNVVVRFLANDDPRQSAKAKALIAANRVLIPHTVLLETGWVLSGAYGFEPVEIAGFLRALLGLPQVRVEEPQAIAEALDHHEAGLDFADALHLALSKEAPEFATFDTRFAKRAARLQGRKLRQP